MATRAERKALLFLGIVIALGASVRAFRIYSSRSPADALGREALEAQIQAADSARHSKFGKSKARRGGGSARAAGGRARSVPRPPSRVDLDIATEPEIEALHGVGPSLARRIVADRDSFGPFGSLDGLRRVRGVGAGLVARLDTTVTFSLLPRPMNTVIPRLNERPKAPVRHRSRATERDTLP
jgi:competence ComEA-like helix-hairpin-helix protein